MTDSEVLRRTISTILGFESPRTILAPGGLVALRLFLHQRGARTLLLSEREYYGAEHFPGLHVRVVPFDGLVAEVARRSPDAVVASVVSWKGEVADAERLVRELRGGARGAPPLICLDWCQAGAAGFPPAEGVEADLLIGDATKWIVPAGVPDRLAFLVAREDLVPPLLTCFSGLYLSGGPEVGREARWIDPRMLSDVARAVRDADPSRDHLTTWHRANMDLARRVAAGNRRADPASALLWFPGRSPDDLDLDELPSRKLVWCTDSGVRITCQSQP